MNRFEMNASQEDPIVCPKCGGEAELSKDRSVILSKCRANDCDRIYSCTECGTVLKTVNYYTPTPRPDICPGCGSTLDYES
jgi:uncharacterized Zn finger protein